MVYRRSEQPDFFVCADPQIGQDLIAGGSQMDSIQSDLIHSPGLCGGTENLVGWKKTGIIFFGKLPDDLAFCLNIRMPGLIFLRTVKQKRLYKNKPGMSFFIQKAENFLIIPGKFNRNALGWIVGL